MIRYRTIPNIKVVAIGINLEVARIDVYNPKKKIAIQDHFNNSVLRVVMGLSERIFLGGRLKQITKSGTAEV